ncbi:MAG: sigma-70 family RNA polymerase sigma factor [Candidatus Eisenbacteria bacterium]|nr:sigma-70 family RNA polymerase sigma factor [Candidatus Eisenbacteria bacterium]
MSFLMTDGAQQTDEALALCANSKPGTPEAAQAASDLLARYQRRVYIWCFRFVREHERALDLAQDVLLNAYRNLETFRGEAKFFSWIFAITRNRCLNASRRPALLSYEESAGETVAGDPDPHAALEEKLDEEALWNLVQTRLDCLEQEALYLRCFERMPVETITELLEIREATGARAVLQRARRKLRAALKAAESHDEGSPHPHPS